ncbi:MAG: PSD1 and planctomycete cytochrome C domain-containing protein [Saprospiraceae bacterium]|nr:PSD1 and planctomycete cytochrome C domain-containing protein [Saprospiraceae bacterium]
MQSFGQKRLPEVVDFNFHVKPILSDRCFKCHGMDDQTREAGLRLDTKEGAFMALGNAKDHYAIIPNDAVNSTLVERIYTADPTSVMPPPESNLTLTDFEKALLKKWIVQGAQWKKHWSFIPIQKPTVPKVEDEDWVHNEIDHFILRKLENNGIKPSPLASKEMLIRRLTFDLTGLPPSLEEVDNYLNDDSIDAYEKVVDRLLASQAYAERMTTEWLDLARYADTHGYQDDLERTMWPWRDWVIHAYAKNMPFDEFVRWQLAGDMLPDPSKEQIIATAFNRNHKITQEGGVIPEEYRTEYVADRAQTFGTAFLGLTMECARCHDHKYDPISQENYYQLFSFFNNVPEHGLIEKYGGIPNPSMILTKEEMATTLSFINNLDTVPEVQLLVMDEMQEPRQTYVLNRGAYDQPTVAVKPKTPESISSFPKELPRNRLGLADWLLSKENPLMARVTVNRFWQLIFGQGIVGTPDDFGNQGSLPTHPELLDWLATYFMENEWNVKQTIKYIVQSSTYQQSAKIRPELLEIDPDNELLARAPRTRLSAEMIRDHALATSGLLVKKVGGPSVKPYQPEGLWAEKTGGGGGSTAKYIEDDGDKLYRRSLYTFWKRTVPPPSMMTFDAASRDFCTVKRQNTSTPLQALVLMNDPQILEACRVMTYQAIEKNENLDDRIAYMFRKVTSRRPNAEELDILVNYYKEELQQFESQPENAEQYLAVGAYKQKEVLSIPEMAAYTIVANAIFNLDEAITKS